MKIPKIFLCTLVNFPLRKDIKDYETEHVIWIVSLIWYTSNICKYKCETSRHVKANSFSCLVMTKRKVFLIWRHLIKNLLSHKLSRHHNSILQQIQVSFREEKKKKEKNKEGWIHYTAFAQIFCPHLQPGLLHSSCKKKTV